jgi:hypothetical protein
VIGVKLFDGFDGLLDVAGKCLFASFHDAGLFAALR